MSNETSILSFESFDNTHPAAWDYYHKPLMGAPGETRHAVYWTAGFVGHDGAVTGDLEWLLGIARAGKQHVEAPIWVRPMYYGEDVQRLLSIERERCARIVEDMVRAVDGHDAIAAIRSGREAP